MTQSSLALFVLAAATSAVWQWIHRLGGFGLILLGIADSSIVPLPGSMDVFTILLSAHNRAWWPYYGAMATVGAVIGGYLTYRLAEKGEKELLEKKIGKQRAERVYKKFEKGGFIWIFVGSMLPPPFPIVPVLMAPGALHYPRRKFLIALTSGRGIRFFAVAYIGQRFGQAIIGFLGQYYRPMLYVVIGLGVAAGVAALLYFKWYRPRKQAEEKGSEVSKQPEHKVA